MLPLCLVGVLLVFYFVLFFRFIRILPWNTVTERRLHDIRSSSRREIAEQNAIDEKAIFIYDGVRAMKTFHFGQFT